MLGTGHPARQAFLFMRSPSLPNTHRRDAHPPTRAGSFIAPDQTFAATVNWRVGRKAFPMRFYGLRGRLVPDRHPDEHATCYVVQGRGLVVISSCGHCGLINTIKTAQAVSGVEKLHAVIGGFHLGIAPPDYIEHTVAELKALAPDVVVPMHCSGRGFIAAASREMPDRIVLSNTGSRFTFGV